MPQPSPKEMFESAKERYPWLTNSKIRKLVQAYNAATGAGQRTVHLPPGRVAVEWLDPTARTAIARVDPSPAINE